MDITFIIYGFFAIFAIVFVGIIVFVFKNRNSQNLSGHNIKHDLPDTSIHTDTMSGPNDTF